EDERYTAFKTCYRSMRIIDDLVDNLKTTSEILTDLEKKQFKAKINIWTNALIKKQPVDNFQNELIITLEKYHIPTWPWEKLSQAMIYDLYHNGFKTFHIFLKYAGGAAVAPASIFMHLCGVNRKNDNYYLPGFDIRQTARPIALFSYLVHIIRDFQKDQADNLNYFADNLLTNYNIDKISLKEIAHGGEITDSFRKLINHYYQYTEYFRQKARLSIDKTKLHLKPQYQLSLELIYNLYFQIFEKIDIYKGKFTASELNPTPDEINNRINQTIINFKAVK
ncbi:MAG: squalene/phytoene synthase family protein, partial [Candidatus Zixiibacteriota bacterium]